MEQTPNPHQVWASGKKRVDHLNWGIADEGPVERCPASENSQPEGKGTLTSSPKECRALPTVKLPLLLVGHDPPSHHTQPLAFAVCLVGIDTSTATWVECGTKVFLPLGCN